MKWMTSETKNDVGKIGINIVIGSFRGASCELVGRLFVNWAIRGLLMISIRWMKINIDTL